MTRIYLGSLLAAMALGQALGWKTYEGAVASYRFGRRSRALAVTLFVLEVAAATGLLTDAGGTRLAVAAGGVAVTGLWAVTAFQAFFRRRKVPNCGCFGPFFRQELRWWVLLEDVAFVGVALLHLRNVIAA